MSDNEIKNGVNSVAKTEAEVESETEVKVEVETEITDKKEIGKEIRKEIREDIREALKKLPKKPGVYIMHDENDSIIYVGKAINLFNRVRSYFRENVGRGPKIDRMISLIDYFEYIVTDSELEALVLENNLIKEHKPKYNTMLMDDKTYPYIKVTTTEKFPRVVMARKLNKDGCKYYGPYTNGQAVKDVIDLINKLYGLRTCTGNVLEKPRACLNYHINQCMAPCMTKDNEKYDQAVRDAMDFLNGNYQPIIRDLKAKMEKASEELCFEDAIKYRDLLESVRAVAEKQKIEDSQLGDRDIIGYYAEDDEAIVQVFFVRNGKMTGREHYHIQIGSEDNVILSFIEQFYSGTPFIPKEIYLPCDINDEENSVEKWLSKRKGGSVKLVVPKIGQKEKLVEMANKNAELVLTKDKEKIKLEEARTIGAVHEIERLLDMPSITRMEAFDISNISGFENVASMVVFENGKAKKSDYRKFKIKTVTGPNDYACMKEVLERRLTRGKESLMSGDSTSSWGKLPDLLLMDGGRGQVNICIQVLEEIGLNIPVCGMVKDDHHNTRGLFFNNIELPIDTHSEGFKLITRIQDEAHRFAIEYHRSLRTKDQVHSVLDDIPGIGPGRRVKLMKAFSSIEDIINSTAGEIAEKADIPQNAAESVYNFFHKSE